jgi:hypothetical protein
MAGATGAAGCPAVVILLDFFCSMTGGIVFHKDASHELLEIMVHNRHNV